jgi:hypothetical protein
MVLIEFHCHGLPVAVNLKYISSIRARTKGGCYVFMTGEPEPWAADESYGEVLQKIRATGCVAEVCDGEQMEV